MKTSGIYSITNIINDKIYIGSSVNVGNRWKQHRNTLNRNKHRNPHLQNAWNKYGEDKFVFGIIKELSIEELKTGEQQYLNKIKLTPDKYYNISEDADKPRLGKPHSEETKRKIREKRKFQIISEDTKRKISTSLLGKKNHFYGKTHSQKTKIKISLAGTGRIQSDECKRKIRLKSKGRKHSEETKQKLRNIFMGHTVSEETRQKISKSLKGNQNWSGGTTTPPI